VLKPRNNLAATQYITKVVLHNSFFSKQIKVFISQLVEIQFKQVRNFRKYFKVKVVNIIFFSKG
jgi:hypothetical protein